MQRTLRTTGIVLALTVLMYLAHGQLLAQEAAPSGGFTIDVDIPETLQRLGKPTINELAVGESAYIGTFTTCKGPRGILHVPRTTLIEEPPKWGHRYRATRHPHGRLELEIKASKAGTQETIEARRLATIQLASGRPCLRDGISIPFKSDELFVVLSIDGHASLEALLSAVVGGDADAPVTSDASEPDKASSDDATARSNQETNWLVLRSKSKIDDSPSIVLIRDSEESRYGSTKPKLVIRCVENTTAIFVNFDDYLGSDAPILTLRVGEQDAQSVRWMISTNKKSLGLWDGRGSIPFLRRIVDQAQLVMRVTPFNDNPLTATFKLNGLQPHLEELAETCNWSLTTRSSSSSEATDKIDATLGAAPPEPTTEQKNSGADDNFQKVLDSVKRAKSKTD